ncbi:hypothetical protein F66182_1258 [Fusarium sp. NRRL 66182]|nr:hypothetical protein F66182_1258 [Fusarium sp. NRRL 66182]
MSIPPHLIRVKRKRDDESPVTFLQFDEGAKRHRSDSNWVYQRRHVGPRPSLKEASAIASRDAKPVIHVSDPSDDAPHTKSTVNTQATTSADASSTSDTTSVDNAKPSEQRRFHISKKMMMSPNTSQLSGTGLNKRARYGPAVFVERSRAKASQRASQALKSIQDSVVVSTGQQGQPTSISVESPAEERRLKKPAARSRQPSPLPEANTRAPLPTSVMSPHKEDMSKIVADMNDWVMKEIGANLQEMEQEKQKAERARFRPKVPAKRYQERHPEVTSNAPGPNDVSMIMSDGSDMDDDDDWVIEEYVRIPAHSMMVNVAPTDVGVLVLDGKEESNLFFGPERDEDEEFDEDEEDENAENYYTADYPEDEVESDDEYGRRPYGYRNGNASDDEEFDDEYYDDDDEMVLEGNNGDGDDATMARISAYMKHSRAFR